MGLLDDAFFGQNGASPRGALYRSPVSYRNLDASPPFPQAPGAAGETGTAPGLPEPSPFGAVPDLTRPASAPQPAGFGAGFGAGAVPFGFQGPGSMQVNPSMLAQPASVFSAGAAPIPFAGGPVTAQPPAGAATTISAAPRRTMAPGADTPDRFMPVGQQADGSIYTMPVFGKADGSATPGAFAPTATPGQGASPQFGDMIADRLARATTGFIGNLHNGPIGAIEGGLGALVTGRHTDAAGIEAEKANAMAAALLGNGVAPADVQAARSNPDLMKTLIDQVYGHGQATWQRSGAGAAGTLATGHVSSTTAVRPLPAAPAVGSVRGNYRFRGGNPADRNNWEQVR